MLGMHSLGKNIKIYVLPFVNGAIIFEETESISVYNVIKVIVSSAYKMPCFQLTENDKSIGSFHNLSSCFTY